MRAVGVALLSALVLAACDRVEAPQPEAASPIPAQANDFPHCGGDLKAGAVRDYFTRLEAVLAANTPVPISFYGEAVTIQSGGRHLTFRREDFRPGAAALLSNAQWREIAGRGLNDLHSVGWRGCILGDGKAGFQSDKDGQLVLTSFDKDRAWSPVRQP
ncbi:MAG: hypothetical protein REJ23_02140 [Brevundimonas sp.]|nr:hypothetical protein [Brevundimonas sp.]